MDPASPSLFDKPGHLIRRAQQIAVSIFAEECKEFGLTPVQYALLCAVRDNPGIDQISLASLVALDRSNTGDVIGRLEERGLLQREAGRVDRRTKTLHVTAEAVSLIARMAEAVALSQRRILAPLSEAEQRQFMAMLAKLVHVNNPLSRAPWRPAVKRNGREAAS
ncbi:MAG TPA: MarR family transcriptional regulator [Alphaproteobacteria bacterium]|jgi:DNA-binding MarR family transcriptional regulator|nr:MarR family transcriptional regulator [Alphaproteobacteria bacterium]